MSKKVPALDSHIGYLLRRVSNQVSNAFARELATQDVTVAEWVALRMLYDTPSLSPTDLAQAMGVTQSAITKIAEKLLAKGWIVIYENDADRRGRYLKLSKSGYQCVPELANIADQNDERFFGHLSEKERASLLTLIERLSNLNNWTDIPTT